MEFFRCHFLMITEKARWLGNVIVGLGHTFTTESTENTEKPFKILRELRALCGEKMLTPSFLFLLTSSHLPLQ